MCGGSKLLPVTDHQVTTTTFGPPLDQPNQRRQLVWVKTLGRLVDHHHGGSQEVEGCVNKTLAFAARQGPGRPRGQVFETVPPQHPGLRFPSTAGGKLSLHRRGKELKLG